MTRLQHEIDASLYQDICDKCERVYDPWSAYEHLLHAKGDCKAALFANCTSIRVGSFVRGNR